MLYAIAGRRENGKTTLAAYLASRHGLRSFFDPRREFHTSPAADFLVSTDQDRLETIVQPDIDPIAEFPEFCGTLRAWISSEQDAGLFVPRSIVVDEVRDADLKCQEFSWLTRCVRRDRVNIILTGHRPISIAPDVRAIVDTWCFFQATHPEDLDVIEEKAGPEIAERCKTLGPREFIWWDDARAVATPCLNPRAWFVPLRMPEPVETPQ